MIGTLGDDNEFRNRGERERGTIAGAIHIPLAQLGARPDEVPTGKPIVVHCASGWRSSVGRIVAAGTGIRQAFRISPAATSSRSAN